MQSYAFVFRECPGCAELNVVKDGFYYCAHCDGPLPRDPVRPGGSGR
ncbi:alkyl hydroperoxide reductase subunit AhpF [Actinomadura cellulosilytica]|uniref:Alkyl hydroperoxide reductase subunit AhpF n=1 Tax=Thermomonospora cellulosilytica TaxID=1411118 RepID=A0A7W3RD79_9ACTN|nr:alkyl hydroperoxide reductase subunit AhpF [Thermomonospora cellulosilytica]